MRSACGLFKKFLADEKGLETVEYAVIAALILGGVILSVGLLAVAVSKKFDDLTAALTPTP